MEEKEIFGENTKDFPGFNTIKSLEKRKYFILNKLGKNIEDETYYYYLINEIREIEKTINFIKWILNNSFNNIIKEIVKKYEMENNKSNDEDNEIEIDDIKETTVYGIIDERQGKNRKLEIILSRNNDINSVSIISQRRKKNSISWKRTKEIKMTVNRLEKILRIIKEKEIEYNESKI